MAHSNHNLKSKLVALSCTLVLTLLFGAATTVQAEEPMLTASQPAPERYAPVQDVNIQTVSAFRIVSRNDAAGTPRAREDVDELIQTAVGGSTAPTANDSVLKISARYQNSEMLSLLSRTSMQEIMTLFTEASQLIDTRHVSPNSYEDRTKAAMEGVAQALENATFLQANRANPNPQALAAVQQQLRQMAYSQPARSASESLGLMQYAAELANRQLGVSREAVALEFLNATIDSLDKYSALLPNAGSNGPSGQVESLYRTAGLEERVVGIGVEMKLDSRGALLEGVIEGSPAAQLGLQAGDVIVAVNQRSIAGQSLSQIADQIGGAAGTTVTVDINRNGQMLRGTIRRREFYVSSVTGTRFLENTKVGYVRLKQFSESSKEDLEKAMLSLHSQGMNGLVLDLRGNPGGLLNESIDLSNMFLPRGTIVATRGRTAEDNTQEAATYEKTWAVPLIVLVDENSASASEIFAAAIQENGRGLILGRHSYGKGTVQTHFPLRTVSGLLKLTTAKFYSPTGREMAGAGVEPDLLVNNNSKSYGTTSQDPDLMAALQVMAQGTPAQMATASARGEAMPYRGQLSNYTQPVSSPVQYQVNYTPNFNNMSNVNNGRIPRPMPLEPGVREF